MSRPEWVPAEIDMDRPSAARVYDYYLGGSHNFEADRRMARQALQLWPELPQIMQANRAFLRRAIRYVVSRGVVQLLDIGAGIPTAGSSHEVASQVDPTARVVYVDSDPVAVAHSKAMLSATPNAAVLRADLRDPEAILAAPTVLELIDFSQPVAVLLVAVLHFVEDRDDPAGILAQLRDAVAPGSFLVISHASSGGQTDRAASHQKLYSQTQTPMTMRSHDEVCRLFEGFDIVEPGIVPMPQWHPEIAPSDETAPLRTPGFAGVGRKP